MKNKGLVIALVILAGFLVMVLVTIFLITIPDITTNKVKSNTVETVVSATIENIEEEIEPQQEMGYSINHYRYNDGINVDIEYPEIFGMDNMLYQNNLNQKLSINASSILLLHEDKDKIKSLNVTCTVQEFDEKKMTVVYEGEMFFSDGVKNVTNVTPETKSSKTSSKKTSSQKSSSSKNNNRNVDPNYDNYGGGVNNNYNNYNNYNSYQSVPIQQSPQSSNYDTYAPVTNQNNSINMAPGASPINGFASTKITSKKIFWTSSINMEECKDCYLTESVSANELVNYLLGNKVEIEDLDDAKKKKVMSYIKKIKKSTLEKMINNADFQNTGLSSWPQIFSYIKNDILYFSFPVSHDLGDYVLISYELSSK